MSPDRAGIGKFGLGSLDRYSRHTSAWQAAQAVLRCQHHEDVPRGDRLARLSISHDNLVLLQWGPYFSTWQVQAGSGVN